MIRRTKIYIKFILMFILVFMVSSCSYKTQNELPYITFQKNIFEINYGRKYIDLLSSEFIQETNGTIEIKSPLLDTSEEGSQIIVYRVYNQEEPSKYKEYEIEFVIMKEKFIAYPHKSEIYYFTCNDWITNQFDSRIVLKATEMPGNSNKIYIGLENEETKTIKMLAMVGTELGSWIEGTYEYLGEQSYKFTVFKVYVNDYQEAEGPLEGNFYRDGEKLYYLGESNDFKNYNQYPYCVFGIDR